MPCWKSIRHSLRTFGVEHYYKAKVLPRILYVEGSTDLAILKSLARKLKHRAYDILSGKLNYYYIQDTIPGQTLEKSLEKTSGAFQRYEQHFHTLKHFVSGFRGIAVFDSDGREIQDRTEEDLAVVYWKNHEIENYFITPELILKYVESIYQSNAPLFKRTASSQLKAIIDKQLLTDVFSNDESQLQEFWQLSKNLRRTTLRNFKMSKFTEQVFEAFRKSQDQPILLKKGEYYQLIEFMDVEDIPDEVITKLDLIVKYLQWDGV